MKRRISRWEPEHRASLRHRVAVEAARILYTREMKEYFQAKREAARRQGTHHLPSNREIHEQLLHIARTLDREDHERRLRRMRSTALEAMERLQAFHPYVIGSTWTGHIRHGSDIDLNVYSDDLDAVCSTLQDYQVEIEVVRTHKNQEEREFTHLHLSAPQQFCEIEVTVYPHAQRHERPRCGITGGPMRRGTLAELRQLLKETLPASSAQDFAWIRPCSPERLLEWIPELRACQGVLQNEFHHLDVYEHSLATIAGLESLIDSGYARLERFQTELQRDVDTTLLLLAGACHDLGKPATQSFSRDGRIRFLGHESVGAEMVRGVAARLRLGPRSEPLRALVANHMEAVRIPSEQGELSRIHALFRRLGANIVELALLSLADVEAACGPAQSVARREEHFQFVEFLLEQHYQQGFVAHPCVPVSQDDLKEEFAIASARLRRHILEWLTDLFVDGEFESAEEGLSLVGDFLSDPHNRPLLRSTEGDCD